jgi:hypothetical protein
LGPESLVDSRMWVPPPPPPLSTRIMLSENAIPILICFFLWMIVAKLQSKVRKLEIEAEGLKAQLRPTEIKKEEATEIKKAEATEIKKEESMPVKKEEAMPVKKEKTMEVGKEEKPEEFEVVDNLQFIDDFLVGVGPCASYR